MHMLFLPNIYQPRFCGEGGFWGRGVIPPPQALQLMLLQVLWKVDFGGGALPRFCGEGV